MQKIEQLDNYMDKQKFITLVTNLTHATVSHYRAVNERTRMSWRKQAANEERAIKELAKKVGVDLTADEVQAITQG